MGKISHEIQRHHFDRVFRVVGGGMLYTLYTFKIIAQMHAFLELCWIDAL
jgi:hypothetical protein